MYITEAELRNEPYNLSVDEVDPTYAQVLISLTKEVIDKVCYQNFEKEGSVESPVEKLVDGTGKDTVFLPKRLLQLLKVRIYSQINIYQEYDASEFIKEYKYLTWNIYSNYQSSLRYRVENFSEGRGNIGVVGTWGWESPPLPIKYLQGRLIGRIVEDNSFAENLNTLRVGDFSQTLAIRGDNEFYITGVREFDLIIRRYRESTFGIQVI